MCDDAENKQQASDWTLDDLSQGERALLGALRGWKAANRGGGLGVVLHAVKGAGLPLGAVLPLASLLGTLEMAARQDGRNLRCVACRGVSRDEALLLDAVAAAQWGMDGEAHAILADWFPGSAASAAAAAQKVGDLARALWEAEAAFPGGRVNPERRRSANEDAAVYAVAAE